MTNLMGLSSLYLLADVVMQESLREKEVEIQKSTPLIRDGSIKNDSLKSPEKAMVGQIQIHADNEGTKMHMDTRQTSEPRKGRLSRSGRLISATWKVKENLQCKSAPERKFEFRLQPALGSRSRKMIKENDGMNAASDFNIQDQETRALALILVEMSNDKRGTCLWDIPPCQEPPSMILEPTERNLEKHAQLNEQKCISKATAQYSSRKRKLPSDEKQAHARKKMKGAPHVCEICGKSFATGVQLGGHKRAHYQKDPAESANHWFIRKSVDSELRFFLTIRKNDKCISSDGSDL